MKLKHSLALLLIFLAVAVQARLRLQKPDQPNNVPQIAVGMVAPDFILEDAKGQKVNLTEQVKKQPVLLVFYRGYW